MFSNDQSRTFRYLLLVDDAVVWVRVVTSGLVNTLSWYNDDDDDDNWCWGLSVAVAYCPSCWTGEQLMGCCGCCGFVEPILQAIVAEDMLLLLMLLIGRGVVGIALTIICLRPLALAILNMVAGWMAVRFLMAM